MIKSTPIDAPDRKSLELAKEAMDDVNSYVNEMKRDNETRQLINEVQNSITELTMVSKMQPEDVTLMDYGRLNADGEVRLSESTSQQFGKMKTRHVFIFDKVLIICKANRNNTYTYKAAYIVSELHPSLDNPMPDGKMGTISRKIASASQHLLYLIREERACTQDSVRHLTLAFKGCLVNDRQCVGLVHSEHVRRVRTNSVQGICSPLDSPVGMRVDRKESTVLPKRMFGNGYALGCTFLYRGFILKIVTRVIISAL
ncbi:unnamed protein product [Strongylus vulgaris]|uniref:SOS1/NGEF-like PH domain-containing protein n=1 Tax=Strongylus vulgaris TaxID=40348 RepID=A0A3P7K1L1_STRVU|nr:unnamed protein product [Strongylus vulgaris]